MENGINGGNIDHRLPVRIERGAKRCGAVFVAWRSVRHKYSMAKGPLFRKGNGASFLPLLSILRMIYRRLSFPRQYASICLSFAR